MKTDEKIAEEILNTDIYCDAQFKRDLIEVLKEISSSVWNINYEFEKFREESNNG